MKIDYSVIRCEFFKYDIMFKSDDREKWPY